MLAWKLTHRSNTRVFMDRNSGEIRREIIAPAPPEVLEIEVVPCDETDLKLHELKHRLFNPSAEINICLPIGLFTVVSAQHYSQWLRVWTLRKVAT